MPNGVSVVEQPENTNSQQVREVTAEHQTDRDKASTIDDQDSHQILTHDPGAMYRQLPINDETRQCDKPRYDQGIMSIEDKIAAKAADNDGIVPFVHDRPRNGVCCSHKVGKIGDGIKGGLRTERLKDFGTIALPFFLIRRGSNPVTLFVWHSLSKCRTIAKQQPKNIQRKCN